MDLVLASKSPRRKLLLEQLGLKFDVVPSGADESSIKESAPGELAMKVAKLKAMTVSEKLHQPAIVLGADTMVFFEGRPFGKPRDKEDARRMLKMLSGEEHRVFTGVCAVNNITHRMLADFQVTKVKFRQLDQRDIERCANHRLALECAGAYSPETSSILFESIDGSHTNVMGLPMEKAIPMLRKMGVRF
jgi:septum formation protein